MEPIPVPPDTCAFCTDPFTEATPRAKSHACACEFHTACLVQRIRGTHWYLDTYCNCGALLAAPHHPHGGSITHYDAASADAQDTQAIAAAKAKSTFAADARALRAKMRERTAALKAFKGKAAAAKGEFKAAVDPLIQSIRDTRETMKGSLKESPECKENMRAKTSYSRALTIFKTKYALRMRHVEKLKLLSGGLRRSRYRNSEERLNHLFRVPWI